MASYNTCMHLSGQVRLRKGGGREASIDIDSFGSASVLSTAAADGGGGGGGLSEVDMEIGGGVCFDDTTEYDPSSSSNANANGNSDVSGPSTGTNTDDVCSGSIFQWLVAAKLHEEDAQRYTDHFEELG